MKRLRLLFAATALAFGLNAAAAQSPQAEDADELMRTCATTLKSRMPQEALWPCARAARLKPDDFRAHALAGFAYMGAMQFKEASESFARAIQLQPKDGRLYLLKAKADTWRGATDEAVAACRKAIELDPDSAEAYLMLGDALRGDEKRRDEAVAAYRSAVKLDPRQLPAYAALGQTLERAKDEKGAEEVFKEATAIDPRHMAGRFELGRMLVKQGRLDEARKLWEGRTSDEDNTHPNFIEVLERAEKLKRAADALARKPEDPDALIEMGYAVMEGDSWVVDGRQERAIVYFRKALEKRPGDAKAQYAICKAYVQLADTFEKKRPLADEEIAKLRRLDPKLADEIEAYRKSYSGGLTVAAPPKRAP
jgi:superkiller protein 3